MDFSFAVLGKGQRKSATHTQAAPVKQRLCVLIILCHPMLPTGRKEVGVGGPKQEWKKLCPKLMPSGEEAGPRASDSASVWADVFL